jgi:hypothetical protein
MASFDPFIISTRSVTRPVAEYWAEIGGMNTDIAMHIIERALGALVEAGAISPSAEHDMSLGA